MQKNNRIEFRATTNLLALEVKQPDLHADGSARKSSQQIALAVQGVALGTEKVPFSTWSELSGVSNIRVAFTYDIGIKSWNYIANGGTGSETSASYSATLHQKLVGKLGYQIRVKAWNFAASRFDELGSYSGIYSGVNCFITLPSASAPDPAPDMKNYIGAFTSGAPIDGMQVRFDIEYTWDSAQAIEAFDSAGIYNIVGGGIDWASTAFTTKRFSFSVTPSILFDYTLKNQKKGVAVAQNENGAMSAQSTSEIQLKPGPLLGGQGLVINEVVITGTVKAVELFNFGERAWMAGYKLVFVGSSAVEPYVWEIGSGYIESREAKVYYFTSHTGFPTDSINALAVSLVYENDDRDENVMVVDAFAGKDAAHARGLGDDWIGVSSTSFTNGIAARNRDFDNDYAYEFVAVDEDSLGELNPGQTGMADLPWEAIEGNAVVDVTQSWDVTANVMFKGVDTANLDYAVRLRLRDTDDASVARYYLNTPTPNPIVFPGTLIPAGSAGSEPYTRGFAQIFKIPARGGKNPMDKVDFIHHLDKIKLRTRIPSGQSMYKDGNPTKPYYIMLHLAEVDENKVNGGIPTFDQVMATDYMTSKNIMILPYSTFVRYGSGGSDVYSEGVIEFPTYSAIDDWNMIPGRYYVLQFFTVSRDWTTMDPYALESDLSVHVQRSQNDVADPSFGTHVCRSFDGTSWSSVDSLTPLSIAAEITTSGSGDLCLTQAQLAYFKTSYSTTFTSYRIPIPSAWLPKSQLQGSVEDADYFNGIGQIWNHGCFWYMTLEGLLMAPTWACKKPIPAGAAFSVSLDVTDTLSVAVKPVIDGAIAASGPYLEKSISVPVSPATDALIIDMFSNFDVQAWTGAPSVFINEAGSDPTSAVTVLGTQLAQSFTVPVGAVSIDRISFHLDSVVGGAGAIFLYIYPVGPDGCPTGLPLYTRDITSLIDGVAGSGPFVVDVPGINEYVAEGSDYAFAIASATRSVSAIMCTGAPLSQATGMASVYSGLTWTTTSGVLRYTVSFSDTASSRGFGSDDLYYLFKNNGAASQKSIIQVLGKTRWENCILTTRDVLRGDDPASEWDVGIDVPPVSFIFKPASASIADFLDKDSRITFRIVLDYSHLMSSTSGLSSWSLKDREWGGWRSFVGIRDVIVREVAGLADRPSSTETISATTTPFHADFVMDGMEALDQVSVIPFVTNELRVTDSLGRSLGADAVVPVTGAAAFAMDSVLASSVGTKVRFLPVKAVDMTFEPGTSSTLASITYNSVPGTHVSRTAGGRSSTWSSTPGGSWTFMSIPDGNLAPDDAGAYSMQFWLDAPVSTSVDIMLCHDDPATTDPWDDRYGTIIGLVPTSPLNQNEAWFKFTPGTPQRLRISIEPGKATVFVGGNVISTLTTIDATISAHDVNKVVFKTYGVDDVLYLDDVDFSWIDSGPDASGQRLSAISGTIPGYMIQLSENTFRLYGELESTLQIVNFRNMPVIVRQSIAVSKIQVIVRATQFEDACVSSRTSVPHVQIAEVSCDMFPDVLLDNGYYAKSEGTDRLFKLIVQPHAVGNPSKIFGTATFRDIFVTALTPAPRFMLDTSSVTDSCVAFYGDADGDAEYVYRFAVPAASASHKSIEFDVYFVLSEASPRKFLVKLLNQYGAVMGGIGLEATADGYVNVLSALTNTQLTAIWPVGQSMYFMQGAWVHMMLLVKEGNVIQVIAGDPGERSDHGTTAFVEWTSGIDYDAFSITGMSFIADDAAVHVDNIKASWLPNTDTCSYGGAPGTSISSASSAWVTIDTHSSSSAVVGYDPGLTALVPEYSTSTPITLSAYDRNAHIVSTEFSYYDAGTDTWIPIGTDTTSDQGVYTTTWDVTGFSDNIYDLRVAATALYMLGDLVGYDYAKIRIDGSAPSLTLGTIGFVSSEGLSIPSWEPLADSTMEAPHFLVSAQTTYFLSKTETGTITRLILTIRDPADNSLIDEIVIPLRHTPCNPLDAIIFPTFWVASLETFWYAHPLVESILLTATFMDASGHSGSTLPYKLDVSMTHEITVIGDVSRTMTYAQALTGTVHDWFNAGRPGEQIDVYIDDLYYGSATTDVFGGFALPMETLDFYSDSLFSTGGVDCSADAAPLLISGATVPVIGGQGTRVEDVAFATRHYEPGKQIGLVLNVQEKVTAMTGAGWNVDDFEGVVVDLMIPNLWSDFFDTTTFEDITITFILRDNSRYAWTLPKDALVDYFQDLGMPGVAGSINGIPGYIMRVPVPFSVLQYANEDTFASVIDDPTVFSPASLIAVEVIGTDAAVYPSSDDLDMTQFLAVSGIYFADTLQGATTWRSNDPEGDANREHVVSYKLARSLIEAAVTTTISIAPLPITIDPGIWEIDALNAEYSDFVSFDLIDAATADGVRLCDARTSYMILDSMFLSALDAGVPTFPGLPVDPEATSAFDIVKGSQIKQSMTFQFLSVYSSLTDLAIKYSGNPFFSASSHTIASSFDIVAETAIISSELGMSYNPSSAIPAGFVFDAKLDGDFSVEAGSAKTITSVGETPVFAEGLIDECMVFDQDTYLRSNIDASSSWTLSANVLPNGVDPSAPVFDSRVLDESGDVTEGIGFAISSQGLTIYYDGEEVHHPFRFVAGSWYHVAVTMETHATLGIITSYVNGELVGCSTGLEFADGGHVGAMCIGHDVISGSNFAGLIDEIVIYPTALPQDDPTHGGVRDLGRSETRYIIDHGESRVIAGRVLDNDNHALIPGITGIEVSTITVGGSTSPLSLTHLHADGTWASGGALPSSVPESEYEVNVWSDDLFPYTASAVAEDFLADRTRLDSFAFFTCDDGDDTNDPTTITITVSELLEGKPSTDPTLVLWEDVVDYDSFTGGRVGEFGAYEVSLDVHLEVGKRYAVRATADAGLMMIGLAGGGVYFNGGRGWEYDSSSSSYILVGTSDFTYTDGEGAVLPIPISDSSDLAFTMSLSNYWDASLTGLVMIDTDPSAVEAYVPWTVFPVDGAGLFTFLIDTAPSSPTYLEPGVTYDARMVYDPEMLGIAEPNYLPAQVDFKIVVDGAPTRLEYVVQDEDREESVPVSSLVYPTDSTLSANEGDPYTRFVARRIYTDETSMEFKLINDVTGAPIPNKVIWLQIGMSPNSLTWNEALGGSTEYDYLAWSAGGVFDDYGFGTHVEQEAFGKPVFYPHFVRDGSGAITGVEWWTSTVWTYAVTDAAGVAEFEFAEGIPVDDAVGLAKRLGLLGSCDSIDDIQFFARAAYIESFDWSSMALVEANCPGGAGAIVDECLDTESRIWFDGTLGSAPAFNQGLQGSYARGRLVLDKETVMLSGGGRTVRPEEAQEFDLFLGLVEANAAPNGKGVVAEMVGEDYVVPEFNDKVSVRIYEDGGRMLLDESELSAYTDETGVATVSVNSMYTESGYLMPSIYKGEAFTSGGAYYQPAPSYTFKIDVQSATSYNLSMPSLDVEYGSLLEEAAVPVRADDLDQMLDVLSGLSAIDQTDIALPDWNSRYPVIVGMVAARNVSGPRLPISLEEAWTDYQIEVSLLEEESGSALLDAPSYIVPGTGVEITPEGLSSADFEDAYLAAFPENDGFYCTIMVNGEEQVSLTVLLPGNCTEWQAFAIPLDSFADWKFIDADGDGEITPDEWVSGESYVDSNEDGVADTWVPNPLDVSFHVESIGIYYDKELLISSLKVVSSPVMTTDITMWDLLSEIPIASVVDEGLYTGNAGTGGSYTTLDIDGNPVSFEDVYINVTRFGPSSDEITMRNVETPAWAEFLDDDGKAVVEDGVPLYGAVPESWWMLHYHGRVDTTRVPTAGDLVTIDGSSLGTVAGVASDSTAVAGFMFVFLSPGTTIDDGDIMSIGGTGDGYFYAAASDAVDLTGFPLDSAAVEGDRLPAYHFTAGSMVLPSHVRVDALCILHEDAGYVPEAAQGILMKYLPSVGEMGQPISRESEAGYCTVVELLDLFHDVNKPGPAGVLPDWRRVAGETEMIMEGWDWEGASSSDGVAYARLAIENPDTYEMDYQEAIRMRSGGSASPMHLLYPDVYLPYRATFDGYAYVPLPWDPAANAYKTASADFGSSVVLELSFLDLQQGISATYTRTVGFADAATFIPYTIDPTLTTYVGSEVASHGWVGTCNPALESRSVVMKLSVTCSDGKAAYWGNMTMTGRENFIVVSTGMQSDLEQRSFSSRLIGFTTTRAGTNLGLDRFQVGTGYVSTVDDLQFEITGDLKDALDVQDYGRADPFPTDDWEQIKAAFHDGDADGRSTTGDGNDWTYYEFPWDNADGSDADGDGPEYFPNIHDIDFTTGSADDLLSRDIQLRLKVRDSIADDPDYQEPTVVSGFLRIYDCYDVSTQNLGNEIGYHATLRDDLTRKITLVVVPWTYQRFSNYEELAKTTGMTDPASYSTSFTSGDLVLNGGAGGGTDRYVDSLQLQYRKSVGAKDLVIGKWDSTYDTKTVDTNDATDPDYLIGIAKVHDHDVDDYLIQPLYKLLDWSSPAEATSGYQTTLDTSFGTHSMLFMPSNGVNNQYGAPQSWMTIDDTSPLVTVFPDATPSLKSIALLMKDVDAAALQSDTINVDIYNNKRVHDGYDVYGNETFITVPDFTRRFAQAPSTLSFLREAVVDGRLDVNLPTLGADTHTLTTGTVRIDIDFDKKAYFASRVSLDYQASPYDGSYIFLSDPVQGPGPKPAFVVYLKDDISFMGFPIERQYADAYYALPWVRDSPPEISVDPGSYNELVMIEVVFDKKDTAREISSKIYQTLIANERFSSRYKVERFGPSLEFTAVTGMTINPCFDDRVVPIWTGSLITGGFLHFLGNVDPLFSYSWADGLPYFDDEPDGTIDAKDGYYGYTVVISPDAGKQLCVGVSSGNTASDMYSYIGSDDLAGDVATRGAAKLAASELDAAVAVDVTRLPSMTAHFSLTSGTIHLINPTATLGPDMEHFGYEFIAADPSLVYGVTVKLYAPDTAGTTTIDGRKYSLKDTFTDHFNGEATLIGCHELSLSTVYPEMLVQIEVTWKESAPTEDDTCAVAFTGAWFEDKSSASHVIVETFDNADVSLPIPLQPFSVKNSWVSKTWRGLVDANGDGDYQDANERPIKGDLEGIEIDTMSTIDLMDVGIIKSSINGSFAVSTFEKSFNEQDEALIQFAFDMGSAGSPVPAGEWTVTGGTATGRTDVHHLATSFDLDLDGSYDMTVDATDLNMTNAYAWRLQVASTANVAVKQIVSVTSSGAIGEIIDIVTEGTKSYIDVRPTSDVPFRAGNTLACTAWGSGNDKAIIGLPYAVAYDDGSDFVAGYDLDGSGVQEMVVADKVSIETYVVDDTAIEQTVTSSELRIDADEDGLFDYIRVDYDSVSSRAEIADFMVNWSQTDNAWRRNAWDYSESKHMYGYEEMVDYNGDGQFDISTNNVDEWPDPVVYGAVHSDASLATDYISDDVDAAMTRTYETHYITQTFTCVDPVIGAYSVQETSTVIDIVANRTFAFRDCDGDHVYTLPVIVFEDLAVPIDPRTNMPVPWWQDPHGSLYFVQDASGNWGTALVFSHTSFTQGITLPDGRRLPLAIGVAIDYDGDHAISADRGEINVGFQDSFFPTNWMVKGVIYGGITDYTQIIYDEANARFDAMLSSDPMYWVKTAVDCAANIAIMVAQQWISSKAGPFVGAIAGMAMHYIYRSYSRTMWEEIDRLQQIQTTGGLSKSLEYTRVTNAVESSDLTTILQTIESATSFWFRSYPYPTQEVLAIGSARPLEEDPWQKYDIIAAPASLPVFRDVIPGVYVGALVAEMLMGAEAAHRELGFTSAADAQYYWYNSKMTRDWHDVYRSSGVVDKEVPLVLKSFSCVVDMNLVEFKLMQTEGVTVYPNGTVELGAGDKADFVAIIRMRPKPEWDSDLYKWLLHTLLNGSAFVLDFEGQNAIAAFGGEMPDYVFDQNEGLNYWEVGFVWKATVKGDDGVVLTWVPPASEDEVGRMYYRDVTQARRSEETLARYTNGRLGAIMPLADINGGFSLVAVPASPFYPNFYRTTDDEVNAIRDSGTTYPVNMPAIDMSTEDYKVGDIIAHDYEIGKNEIMYEIDYAITSLISHSSRASEKATQGGLFSIFLGGDFRIWGKQLLIQAVNVIITVIVTKAITSNIKITKVGKSGRTYETTLDKGWSSAGDCIKDVLGEVLDELVKEQLVSETAKLLGAPAEFSDWLGETFWSTGEMLENWQESRSTVKNARKLAQTIRDSGTSRQELDTARTEAEQMQQQLQKELEIEQLTDPDLPSLRVLNWLKQQGAEIEVAQHTRDVLDEIADAIQDGMLDHVYKKYGAGIKGKVAARAYAAFGGPKVPSVIAEAMGHAVVDAIQFADKLNKDLPAGSRLGPEEIMNSQYMQQVFAIPADAFQGFNLFFKRGFRTTEMTWDEIVEKYKDGEDLQGLLELMRKAKVIDLFDPHRVLDAIKRILNIGDRMKQKKAALQNLEMVPRDLVWVALDDDPDAQKLAKATISVAKGIGIPLRADQISMPAFAEGGAQSMLNTMSDVGIYNDLEHINAKPAALVGGVGAAPFDALGGGTEMTDDVTQRQQIRRVIDRDTKKIEKMVDANKRLVAAKEIWKVIQSLINKNPRLLQQFPDLAKALSPWIGGSFENFLIGKVDSAQFPLRGLFSIAGPNPDGSPSIQMLLFVKAMLSADLGVVDTIPDLLQSSGNVFTALTDTLKALQEGASTPGRIAVTVATLTSVQDFFNQISAVKKNNLQTGYYQTLVDYGIALLAAAGAGRVIPGYTLSFPEYLLSENRGSPKETDIVKYIVEDGRLKPIAAYDATFVQALTHALTAASTGSDVYSGGQYIRDHMTKYSGTALSYPELTTVGVAAFVRADLIRFAPFLFNTMRSETSLDSDHLRFVAFTGWQGKASSLDPTYAAVEGIVPFAAGSGNTRALIDDFIARVKAADVGTPVVLNLFDVNGQRVLDPSTNQPYAFVKPADCRLRGISNWLRNIAIGRQYSGHDGYSVLGFKQRGWMSVDPVSSSSHFNTFAGSIPSAVVDGNAVDQLHAWASEIDSLVALDRDTERRAQGISLDTPLSQIDLDDVTWGIQARRVLELLVVDLVETYEAIGKAIKSGASANVQNMIEQMEGLLANALSRIGTSGIVDPRISSSSSTLAWYIAALRARTTSAARLTTVEEIAAAIGNGRDVDWESMDSLNRAEMGFNVRLSSTPSDYVTVIIDRRDARITITPSPQFDVIHATDLPGYMRDTRVISRMVGVDNNNNLVPQPLTNQPISHLDQLTWAVGQANEWLDRMVQYRNTPSSSWHIPTNAAGTYQEISLSGEQVTRASAFLAALQSYMDPARTGYPRVHGPNGQPFLSIEFSAANPDVMIVQYQLEYAHGTMELQANVDTSTGFTVITLVPGGQIIGSGININPDQVIHALGTPSEIAREVQQHVRSQGSGFDLHVDDYIAPDKTAGTQGYNDVSLIDPNGNIAISLRISVNDVGSIVIILALNLPGTTSPTLLYQSAYLDDPSAAGVNYVARLADLYSESFSRGYSVSHQVSQINMGNLPFSIIGSASNIIATGAMTFTGRSNLVFRLDSVSDPSSSTMHNFYPADSVSRGPGRETVRVFFSELETIIELWETAQLGGDLWSCDFAYESALITNPGASRPYLAPVSILNLDFETGVAFSISNLAADPVYAPWQDDMGTFDIMASLDNGEIRMVPSLENYRMRTVIVNLDDVVASVPTFLARPDVYFDEVSGDGLMIGSQHAGHIDLILRAHTTPAGQDGMYVWLNLRTGEAFLRGVYSIQDRSSFIDNGANIGIPGLATNSYPAFFAETISFVNMIQRELVNRKAPGIPLVQAGAGFSITDTAAVLRIIILDSSTGRIVEIKIKMEKDSVGGGMNYYINSKLALTPIDTNRLWESKYSVNTVLDKYPMVNSLYYHQWLGCTEASPIFPTGGGNPYYTIDGEQKGRVDSVSIIQSRHSIMNFLAFLRGDPSPYRLP